MILVKDLSKIYRIGLRRHAPSTFREMLVEKLTFPISNFKRIRQLTRFEQLGRSMDQGKMHDAGVNPFEKGVIWALKNVSFGVKKGEVLGIIGRNGSGKSTLLKILSRITEPTAGEARIYGTTSSILEVGTGFHPELTGRENIFLNGTILGMKRREIDRKFDEIVSFAELGEFIDTPVKRYSSGMYVRLAFSVAAYLETDVLIVDEVLAVGDVAFQNKCLGKMDSAARAGRTVLFVSHSLGTVERLCNRAVLLDKGSIIAEGRPSEVINRYLQSQFPENGSATTLLGHPGRRNGSEVILREARLYSNGEESKVFPTGSSLEIRVSFSREEPIRQMHFGIIMESAAGQALTAFPSSVQSPHLLSEKVREGTITCKIPCLHLLPGIYYLTFLIKSLYKAGPLEELDRIDRAVQFSVQAADVFASGHPLDSIYGVFFEEAKWHFEGA